MHDYLIATAEKFDEYEPARFMGGASTTPPNGTPGDRPGDDYNRRADWQDVIGRHGWRAIYSRGGKIHWCRPGKDDGCSATTGKCHSERGGDLLYVFSTSAAPFEAETCYSKFQAHTLLAHGGDFAKAAKALGAAGYGRQPPILVNRLTGTNGAPNGKPYEDMPPPGTPIIYRASEVVTQRIVWLWPGRIPRGKLTTFAGLGGLGKTFVLCDITARVTTGAPWPDEVVVLPKAPGQVLFISGEDDPDDTLVPRMKELGADLTRIVFLKTELQDRFTLVDLKILERAIVEAGPGLALVVIDPPSCFLGGVDDHKNAEVRALLSPLKSLAKKYMVAIVFNTHFTKSPGVRVEAMMRVMGSVAWVNAVRVAHCFARDADDPERRLFIPMKINIGRERKGLAYQIVVTDEASELATMKWLGEVETTADQATGGPDKSRRLLASEWLIGLFNEKLEWGSEELWKAAKQEGVSSNAIYEAKRKLDLPKARREADVSGKVSWIWWVPADWPHLANPTCQKDSDPFADVAN